MQSKQLYDAPRVHVRARHACNSSTKRSVRATAHLSRLW